MHEAVKALDDACLNLLEDGFISNSTHKGTHTATYRPSLSPHAQLVLHPIDSRIPRALNAVHPRELLRKHVFNLQNRYFEPQQIFNDLIRNLLCLIYKFNLQNRNPKINVQKNRFLGACIQNRSTKSIYKIDIYV